MAHPGQYLISDVDPLFQAWSPDVAAISLVQNRPEKNQQDLATCLINPGEWEVRLPKDKTVQQIQPFSGHVHINRNCC